MTSARRCDVAHTSRPALTESLPTPHAALASTFETDQRVTRQQTLLIRAAALLAVLVAALVASSTASATPSCSKAILDDWLDNDRIDRIYDLPCYEAAIDAIPEDLRFYTNAEEVISRAFQNVSGKRLERRELQGPSRVEATPPDVVPAVDSSASTAFPLPLLVLGGMSVVLLAAGGAGYVSRRRRQD